MAGARRPRLDFTVNEYIGAPVGGWSPDVPTWMLPSDQAAELENFVTRPGKIQSRPSFRVAADLTPTLATASPAGFVVRNPTEAYVTRRLRTSGYTIEPWNIQRVRSTTANPSASPVEAAAYLVSVTDKDTTKLTLTDPGLALGPRKIDFNGHSYGVAYSGFSNNVIDYDSGIKGWDNVVLDLDNYALPVAQATGPVGCVDIYGWGNIIVVLGGRYNFESGLASASALMYSNPLVSLSNSAADWQDPVSGLNNKNIIDSDHTDPGVALASVPSGLLVFRQNSVFMVRGTTDPSTWVIRPVTRAAGCIDARSVVEVDDKVYWMSEQGLMVTNGVTVENVSGPLQYELYRQIASWRENIYVGVGAWWTCELSTNNLILMSFGNYIDNGSTYSMNGQFSALFDPATGAWVKFSTNINPIGGFCLGPLAADQGSMFSLGNASVVQIEGAVPGSTAMALSDDSALWDVADTAGTTTPITATWSARSPQAALGARRKSQLKRVYADYAGYTGSHPATIEMKLTDRELSGTPAVLLDDSIAFSEDSSGPRQRFERDIPAEVADLSIQITFTGGSPALSTVSVPAAEVHGVGIEFQPTSDLRPVN